MGLGELQNLLVSVWPTLLTFAIFRCFAIGLVRLASFRKPESQLRLTNAVVKIARVLQFASTGTALAALAWAALNGGAVDEEIRSCLPARAPRPHALFAAAAGLVFVSNGELMASVTSVFSMFALGVENPLCGVLAIIAAIDAAYAFVDPGGTVFFLAANVFGAGVAIWHFSNCRVQVAGTAAVFGVCFVNIVRLSVVLFLRIAAAGARAVRARKGRAAR